MQPRRKEEKLQILLLILVQEELLRKREVWMSGCLEEVGKKYEAVLIQTRKSENNGD
jgi:hypothetical protein